MKKIISFLLTAILVLSFTCCNSKDKVDAPIVIPEDFSFSLTWGCYGESYYDSKTGKLIKTTNATKPTDYRTKYILTEEDKEYIYNLISSLDISTYPNEYDPHDGLSSNPPMTLILKVTQNGTRKTVKAEGTAISFSSENKKGQAFLSVCEAIIDRLSSTEEWKALPDYEFYHY